MKSQDIVILLKLAVLHQQDRIASQPGNGGTDAYSVRGLERSLGISKSEVSASIFRSDYAGLLIKDRESGIPKPNLRALLEFIVHGLKYVFPVKPGRLVRGMPTASSAPVLKDELISLNENIFVWPDPQGEHMGQEIKPLFRSVPQAARHDLALYDLLALADAIRLGNPREAQLAQNLLASRLEP